MRQVAVPLVAMLLAAGSPLAAHGQKIDVADHARLASDPMPHGALLVSVVHRRGSTRMAVEEALVRQLTRGGIKAVGERAIEPEPPDPASPTSREERIRNALQAGTVESVMLVVLQDDVDVEVSEAGVHPPVAGEVPLGPPSPSDPAAKKRELDWDRPPSESQMSRPGLSTAQREEFMTARVDLYAGPELRPLWSMRATISDVGEKGTFATAFADSIVAVARTDRVLK